MHFTDLTPIPFSNVEITGGLWKERIDTVRRVTTRDCIRKCEHNIENFRRSAGLSEGGFEGVFFDDADIYKVLEGVAYVLMGVADAELEKTADEIIDVICTAQQADGYLFNFFILSDLAKRWTDMDHHEDFCVSQLVEAGIAYKQATGKDKLYQTALRAVDQMMRTIGPEGETWISGHEGIEMALVRLYRHTGDERYLKDAEWFVEQRGHTKLRLPISHYKTFFTDEYCQNTVPARELSKVTGHAVRAMYYYSGLADIAAIRGDEALQQALRRLYDNVVPANLYVTGGIGQSAYNEGFTKDWSLPNLTAYCETCASIGMAFWNHRMELSRGEAKYADLVEREIYNGILSGLSLKGDRYFYENPLASVGTMHRREWFHVPCCPTNLVRFLPSIGGYMYATAPGTVFVRQYIESRAHIPLDGGEVALDVKTRYPWEGCVRIRVEACEGEKNLMLRVPGWCEAWRLCRNGEKLALEPDGGYLCVRVSEGDAVEFDMDMPVRRVYADARVREDAGRVAVMRGPVVYCAEEADNPGIPTEYLHADLALSRSAELEAVYEPQLLGGVTTVRAAGIKLIPYYAWDNRESGGMAVWLRERPQ